MNASFGTQIENSRLGTNAVRLGLALLVLFSHSFILGGFGIGPLWPTGTGNMTLGDFAVGGFFALSGLLITLSAIRSNLRRFVVARVLRIFPALIVCLILSAFILAPLIFYNTEHLQADFSFESLKIGVPYFLHNAALPLQMDLGIKDIFQQSTPYGLITNQSVINGSLWTLPLEFRYYGVAFLTVLVGRFLGKHSIPVAGLCITAIALLMIHFGAIQISNPKFTIALQLLFVFQCGVVAATVSSIFMPNPWTLYIFAGLFVTSMVIGGMMMSTVGLGTLVILFPVLAAKLNPNMPNWLENDLSYGIYIYAFPVQQALAFTKVATQNVFLFSIISAFLTFTLALLSWKLIEKPALKLRSRLSPHKA